MKVEYDSRVDAAYIYFDPAESTKASSTYACDPEEVDGQIQLDFDKSGRLIGIEVLAASHLLPTALLQAGTTTE